MGYSQRDPPAVLAGRGDSATVVAVFRPAAGHGDVIAKVLAGRLLLAGDRGSTGRRGLVKFSRAKHFDLGAILLAPLLALLHKILPHLLTLRLPFVCLLVANFFLFSALLISGAVHLGPLASLVLGALIHLLEDLEFLLVELVLPFLLH